MTVDPNINYDSVTVLSPNRVDVGPSTAATVTPWMTLKIRVPEQREHVFTADVENVSSAVGTFIVEARSINDDGTFGVIATIYSSAALTDFPQVGRISGKYQLRMRCSVYTSGTYSLHLQQ